jgi:hypothetical protein
MKFIYTGQYKVNINGMQYHKGDIVELTGKENVEWCLFKLIKETPKEFLKNIKKEGKYGKNLESKTYSGED